MPANRKPAGAFPGPAWAFIPRSALSLPAHPDFSPSPNLRTAPTDTADPAAVSNAARGEDAQRVATSAATRAGLCVCGPSVSLRGMAFHKFKIGQRVSYRRSRDTFPTWYVVTALLPAMNGEFKYQIRRQDGSADLVVNEGDLRENRGR
jgi:hypothetical protein